MHLSSVINYTWNGVFESCRTPILDVVHEIVGIHPILDNEGYALTFTKQPYRIYPKVLDIFRPFRMSLLTFVKVVIVYDSPNINGLDTGVPFYYDLNSCVLEYGKYNYHSVEEMTIMAKILANHKKDKSYLAEGMPDKYVQKWIDQGVLLMRASWTSSVMSDMFDMWYDYTLEFLNCLYKFDETIIFLALGEKACAVCQDSDVAYNTIFIKDFEVNSTPFGVNPISPLSDMFDQINYALIDIGKQAINW